MDERDQPLNEWFVKKIEPDTKDMWILITSWGRYYRRTPCEECAEMGVNICAEHSKKI